MSAAVIVHPKLARASFERAIRPLLTGPEKFEKLGIKLVNFSFPYLEVELSWHKKAAVALLRVDGTDFPYRPVSGWWITPEGGVQLQGSQKVPIGNGFHPSMEDGQQLCWFCFRGWREYHNHSSHQDISWASIRRDNRYSVLQLVAQLHKDLNNVGVNIA